MKCMNCGYVTQKDSCVMVSETLDHPSGKGFINLMQKCQICSRLGLLKLFPGCSLPLSREVSVLGDFTPVMEMEYEGLEPVDLSFGHGWVVNSLVGGKLHPINLANEREVGFYFDGQVEYSVSNVQTKLVRSKRNSL
ncbi:hypothetical protein AQUCO_02000274v1 [Aquilegia coerulea]|uniref:Uncharacterized protein n=1 Tax=Aquilegia coerulea TaxID=218851 RepID=A0A2G5DHK4_AQUCA|nr:hypothetical protein AQUCO_02000274v1 [Aquilegia coerulea]